MKNNNLNSVPTRLCPSSAAANEPASINSDLESQLIEQQRMIDTLQAQLLDSENARLALSQKYHASQKAIAKYRESGAVHVALHSNSEQCRDDVITGRIEHNDIGIAISFNGFSDHTSGDSQGSPIYITRDDGDLKVVVFSDINEEDPTHSISLAGAKNTARQNFPDGT